MPSIITGRSKERARLGPETSPWDKERYPDDGEWCEEGQPQGCPRVVAGGAQPDHGENRQQADACQAFLAAAFPSQGNGDEVQQREQQETRVRQALPRHRVAERHDGQLGDEECCEQGWPIVWGKNAATRIAVSTDVTNSGIWLSATRSLNVYSWNDRRKNFTRPDAHLTGSLMDGSLKCR